MPVAVIVVNFRVYDELDAALATVAPQLEPGDEVVVVDYESDVRALGTVRERHPYARAVARPDNLGFAAGVNLGARETRAPFLLLLNPDAPLEGAVLRPLERYLNDHIDTGVIGPRVLNADGSVQPSARAFPGMLAGLGGRSTWLSAVFPNNPISKRHLLGRDAASPLDVDWVAGSCLMTTRTAFDRVGGFDESFFLYWEDADYCRRVTGIGLRCTYVPSVLVRHSAGKSSALTKPLAIRAFHDSAIRLYEKHSSPVRRLTIPLARAVLRRRCARALRRLSSAAATAAPARSVRGDQA